MFRQIRPNRKCHKGWNSEVKDLISPYSQQSFPKLLHESGFVYIVTWKWSVCMESQNQNKVQAKQWKNLVDYIRLIKAQNVEK